MKIVSYKCLCKNKKQKKFKIICISNVFKTLMWTMSFMLLLLVSNLILSNFFGSLETSLQNFVQSFIKFFAKF